MLLNIFFFSNNEVFNKTHNNQYDYFVIFLYYFNKNKVYSFNNTAVASPTFRYVFFVSKLSIKMIYSQGKI